MNKVSVIVITCKKFQDAWDPFFTLFEKYWPDCPFDVYMVTDFGNHPFPNTISIGTDKGFSGNMIEGLNRIDSKYIIYFQEDYFATGVFNTSKINDCIEIMDKYNVGCLRLAPCPGPKVEWEYSEMLGELRKGDEYRVSTQTAIWDKKMLLALLVDGETGSQFEVRGTKRSCKLDKLFLSVWRGQTPTPYYITGIVRGVWQDGALKLLRNHGIKTSHIKKVVR